ncbi:MAG: tripartite tricarboxylate transporter substrate binding protein [Betaproteobacteria bacterium]|nr:tripartite tricarboxylate transporter substrate binding protein [Betaproteobacteria bacterium]
MTKSYVLTVIAAVFTCACTTHAAQLDYPTRPVRVVVPYLPGGSVDFVGRVLAQKLSEAWGQSVVVDNRAGGATNIGAEIVARAAPDGHTLFMASVASSVNMTLYNRLSYDIVKDFAPVSLLTIIPNLLVLHPSVPAKSVKELIALAKAKRPELTYASAGIGSSTHLAGEVFKAMAGVDIVHVPYKGGGGAVIDLLAGRVAMYFSTIPSSLPYVKAGRLRALAVTSARRAKSLPDLPTVAESGVPGYETQAWNGLMAPAVTPQDVVTRLHTQVMRILALPDVREKFAAQGAEVVASSPAEFAAFIKADIARYAIVVKSAGLKIE